MSISWPKVFISACPVIGIPMGIMNVNKNEKANKLFSDAKKEWEKTNSKFQEASFLKSELEGEFQEAAKEIAELDKEFHEASNENETESSKQILAEIKEKSDKATAKYKSIKEKYDTWIGQYNKLEEKKKRCDDQLKNLTNHCISEAKLISIYANAATISHFLTLVALVVIVSTGILSSLFLVIGVLNLAGIHFYSKRVGELRAQIQNLPS